MLAIAVLSRLIDSAPKLQDLRVRDYRPYKGWPSSTGVGGSSLCCPTSKTLFEAVSKDSLKHLQSLQLLNFQDVMTIKAFHGLDATMMPKLEKLVIGNDESSKSHVIAKHQARLDEAETAQAKAAPKPKATQRSISSFFGGTVLSAAAATGGASSAPAAELPPPPPPAPPPPGIDLDAFKTNLEELLPNDVSITFFHSSASAQSGKHAIGETVIQLHPPLPLVGVSIWTERRCQQNDSLADGYIYRQVLRLN